MRNKGFYLNLWEMRHGQIGKIDVGGRAFHRKSSLPERKLLEGRISQHNIFKAHAEADVDKRGIFWLCFIFLTTLATIRTLSHPLVTTHNFKANSALNKWEGTYNKVSSKMFKNVGVLFWERNKCQPLFLSMDVDVNVSPPWDFGNFYKV